MVEKMKPLILIVEDEIAIRNLLDISLKNAALDTLLCDDATPALNQLKKTRPNLILLDWMLPSMSGIDFIQKLKKNNKTKDIPIIMLTAKAEEEYKIKGLETGADDYITKPFSPRELIARIKTVLRRGVLISPDNLIIIDDLTIDLDKQNVFIADKKLNLTPNSLKLLKFLATHPGRTFSRSELLDYVWGYEKVLDERSVDTEIKRLRKAIGKHGEKIQTIRGVGYQFEPEVIS